MAVILTKHLGASQHGDLTYDFIEEYNEVIDLNSQNNYLVTSDEAEK